jgi:hypothetical protein
MNVTVISNDGQSIDYGYAPEHYASVNLFYAQLLDRREIAGYTIKR